MYGILIVEDDIALSNGIKLALKSDDYLFTSAYNFEAAKTEIGSKQFDLIILDINLPDGSGLDLLSAIRESSSVPVIVLTANDMETDIITGFETGADDYITKPFSLMVLRARVNNQLRRVSPVRMSEVQINDFIFNFERMEFRKGNKAIVLSKTEQKLLRLLVENKGYTLARSELVDKIWTDGAEYVDENALSVTVKRLRNKLGDTHSKHEYIKTVYGIGYTWAVK